MEPDGVAMKVVHTTAWFAAAVSVATGAVVATSLTHGSAQGDQTHSAFQSFVAPDIPVVGRMEARPSHGPARRARQAPPVVIADPAFIGPIPGIAVAAYKNAARVLSAQESSCHLPWQLLAAIGRVESDNGQAQGNRFTTDGTVVPGIFGPTLDGQGGFARIANASGGFQRAEGPMQFIPSTWAVVGRAASGTGPGNPQNINDAALAAGIYLCANARNLATPSGRGAAVLSYNHDARYVSIVLGLFGSYQAGQFMVSPSQFAPAAPQPSPSASGQATAQAQPKGPARPPVSHAPKPVIGTVAPTPKPTAPAPTPTPKPGVITIPILGVSLG